MTEEEQNRRKMQRKSNIKLGLIMASIAMVFFVGIIVKQWLYGGA